MASYPPLVHYPSEAGYRSHFERVYCQGLIATFDGIQIRFKKRDFDHVFFESVSAPDDTFSAQRAERVDWIKAALQDPNSERRVGWNSARKRLDFNRRVAIVMGNYVVVIRIDRSRQKGRFITAYVANQGRTLAMIKRGPLWT